MKKGFFLSLVSFILLLYAVTTLNLKSQAIIEGERTYEEAMKAYSYQLILSQFGKEGIEKMLYLVSRQALYKLSNYTALCPISREDYIDDVIEELITNGEADGKWFKCGKGLKYEDDEKEATLSHFKDAFNTRLKKIGFELVNFEARINEVRDELVDYYDGSICESNVRGDCIPVVMFNYSVEVKVKDAVGSSYSSFREDGIIIKVQLDGMLDPLINRFIYNNNIVNGSRWIMLAFPSYQRVGSFSLFSGNIEPPPFNFNGETVPVEAGQGWFYGPLVHVDEADSVVEEGKAFLYILYGEFDEIDSYSYKDQFGAYIILGDIERGGDSCIGNGNYYNVEIDGTYNRISKDQNGNCEASSKTTKPFLVIDMNRDDFEEWIGREGAINPSNHKALLFITDVMGSEVENEPWLKNNVNPSIYLMEYARDNVACGYYFVGYGVSFLHRMLDNWQDYIEEDSGFGRSKPVGIYSTLVEEEFLGDNNEYSDMSSIDYEFMLLYEGKDSASDSYYVRGFPGCKSAKMCGGDYGYKVKPFVISRLDNYGYIYNEISHSTFADILCEIGEDICIRE